MIRFASLLHQTRLVMACVLTISLFALATPSVQADAISETWDTSGSDAPNWPDQWQIIDNNQRDGRPSPLVFSIKDNAGNVQQTAPNFTRHALALIQASKASGTTADPVFTNLVMKVDVSMYRQNGVGLWLLARYAKVTVNGVENPTASYYAVYFGQSSNNVYTTYIARTDNGGIRPLTPKTNLVVDPPSTGDVRYLTFTIKNTADGSVQLDLTYGSDNSPEATTTKLAVLDTDPKALTGAGQVGLKVNLSTLPDRYVRFDNFSVQELDADTSDTSATPKPAQ